MLSFEQILKILRDESKTDWQKAADMHAALNMPSTADTDRHTASQAKTRKPRGPNKPKPKPVSDAVNGQSGHDADHG